MIDSVPRLAGPYTGAGRTQFSFGFKIFEESDVYVTTAESGESFTSTSLEYGTDFTVTMNSDQDATPGGYVTLTNALEDGEVLAIGSALDYTQEVQLTNFSRFPPSIINEALDRIVVQIQQLVEKLGRAFCVPETSSISSSDLLAKIFEAAEAVELYAYDMPHVVANVNALSGSDYGNGFYAIGGYGDAGTSGSNISSRYVTADGSTTIRTLGERFADVVNVKDYGAVGDGATDDTAAIQAAIDTGKHVFIPEGIYLCTNELSIQTEGQIISGAGKGGGYYKANYSYSHVTTLLFKDPADSSATRYVRTRINYRASASDDEDDALSSSVNIQAAYVQLRDLCVYNYCDIPDTEEERLADSTTNYGADWDIGVFVGCRIEVKLLNIAVVGYHQGANVWVDVTQGASYPRFPDAYGNTAAESEDGISGADGFTMRDCLCVGGYWNVKIQGAKSSDGSSAYGDDYYDELTGSTVTDTRGHFGCSDVLITNCTFLAQNHHTGHRYSASIDVSGYDSGSDELIDAVAEHDAGGCLSVDGLAGNSSGRIQGHTYVRNRFGSIAPFVVKLDNTSRDNFLENMIDTSRSTGNGVYDVDGTQITSLGWPTRYSAIFRSRKTILLQVFSTNSFIFSSLYGDSLPMYTGDKASVYGSLSSAGTFSTGCSTFVVGAKNDVTDQDPTGANTGSTAVSMRVIPTPSVSSSALDFYSTSYARDAFVRYYTSSKSLLIGASSASKIYFTIPYQKASDGTITTSGYEILNFTPGVSSGAYIRAGGDIVPITSEGAKLGRSSYLWSDIYAASGAVNTSDAREKQSIEDYPDEVLDAWGDVELRQFLFNAAVEKKGAAARIHAGVIAQQVIEAFEAHGLDATRYGLLCHDEWDDEYETVDVEKEPAQYDEKGELIKEAVMGTEEKLIAEAGDRYGIRYSEALCIEAAYQRRRADRLEARLAAIEARLAVVEAQI